MNRKPRYHPSDAVAPNASSSTKSPSSPSAFVPAGKASQGASQQAGPTGQRLPAVISSPSLQKGIAGGSHRPIDQTFKMNPLNGTMSLAIPIPLTEGRDGFGPKLELSYNSGSGNGYFGIGWQLNVSSITRMTSKRVPMYDGTDTFLLSGEDELVPMGDSEQNPDGFSVQSYQPRVMGDPLKIEQWSRLGDPFDVHWRTISGSNVTCIYGQSQQSRISHTDYLGRSRIFSWLLNSSYDAFGNLITYDYKEEDTQGNDSLAPEARVQESGRAMETSGRAKYLKSIKYGNALPNRDSSTWKPCQYDGQYHFQVILDYGDHDLDNPQTEANSLWMVRQDRFSTSSAGFEVRWLRLCRRILMFHHFPNELSEKACLVRSVYMQYQESPMATFLTAVKEQGHWLNPETKKMESQALPPYTFQYNIPIDAASAKVEHMDTDSLPNLPGPDSNDWQWVDLLGEGAPGLLEQHADGSWNFRKNDNALEDISAPKFQSAVKVLSRPNRELGKSAYFEDLNQDGKLELVCLDDTNKIEGFYHQEKEDWVGYTTFSSIPNQDTAAVFYKQIDLTGDGLADLMAIDPVSHELLWQNNMGTGGFGPLRRTCNGTGVPKLMSEDPRLHITFADMTGDGRPDIVQVSSGNVTYWQNLSHGSFSEPVCMYKAPKLDGDIAISERIRLVDINGSGTSDLIYMPANGGLHVYLNQAGNGWSDAQILETFPVVNQLSSIATVDLFGKGTACVCWVGKVPGSHSLQTLYYVDLAPGPKPNCLASYQNCSGSQMEITYKSSNWFYLHDERSGAPWSTKVGFPVQCVSQVKMSDKITGRVSTKRFTYHDGYYDSHEREFRGFGMVEQLESDAFNSNTSSEFSQPATLTKTWFHTGAMTPSKCRLDRASSAALFWTYWSGEPVNLEDRRDFCRALKGMELRQEIMGVDGTALASYPYMVTDTAHQVVQLSRRRGSLQPSTYRCVPREILKTSSDRHRESTPRYNHELILHTNDYNDRLRSIAISYGHAGEGYVESAQKETVVIYNENEFCLPVVDKSKGLFVKPMPSATRKYRITGMTCSNGDISSAFNRFASNDFQILRNLPEIPYTGLMLPPYSSEALVKVAERRICYRDQDLSQEKPLPLGEFQGYSVMHSVSDLVGGEEWLQRLFRRHLPLATTLDSFMSRYGYVKTKEDDGTALWWRPSSRTLYGSDPYNELVLARRSFYTPTITEDAFGNRTTVEMDEYNILPKVSTDAVGNSTTVDMNYRDMSPLCVVDPNRNRVTYIHDLLGRVVATARSGKQNENVGDNVSTTVRFPTLSERVAFLRCPTQEAALRLMGGASSYRLYCDAQIAGTSVLSTPHPAAFIDFARRTHHADGAIASDTSISITWLDGSLAELQTTTLTGTAGDGYMWNVSEWSLRNGKGDPVRTFQPSNTDTHEFIHASSNRTHATTMVYDPIGRLVGTLYPDHAYSKVRYGTWVTTNYDRGDTVLVQDLSEDEDLSIYAAHLPKDVYSPNWSTTVLTQDPLHKAKVKSSKVYSETPDEVHLDSQDHPILSVKDQRLAQIKSRYLYSPAGYLAQTLDSRGRLAESVASDLLGREILRLGMDTGTTFKFFDCMDRTVILIDGRNWKQRTVYDSIGRKTHLWLSQDGGTEILAESACYGEAVNDAESLNLRGKVIDIRDQSGIQKNNSFDFKGNCVESSTQFTVEYKGLIDWKSADIPDLEPVVHTSRKTFDAMDRVVESEDVEGAVTRHGYGISGQLDQVSYSNSQQGGELWTVYMSNMRYAADGQVEHILYGNGVLATFQYDPASRVLVRKTLVRQSDKRVMEDSQYSYDVMLRLVRSHDAAQPTSYYNNVVVDATSSYTYDTIGRLLSAQGREDANSNARGKSSVGIPCDSTRICRYMEEYQYDDSDNITLVKHHAGPKGQIWVRSYAYEEESLVKEGETGNRLSYTSKSGQTEKWTYGDGVDTGFAGSVIGGGGMHTMSWDPFNRLKSCSRQIKKSGTPETTWYVYNSEGRRVRKVTERSSSGPDDPRKLKETFFFPTLHIYKCKTGDGSGYSKDKRYHLINSAEQKLVAIAEEDKALSSESLPLVRYHMSDKLELDQSGLVITYEEYSPFGCTSFSLRRSKQEASRKYRFAGYERDKETGLYYCNARYYAPWLGRWMTPDPLGTKDGLNLYCYCGNDPVNYVDPTGMFKAMRIAAVPLFKTAMRMNEITKTSSKFEPYQRSWLSEISKPSRGSSPAFLDDAGFLTENEKLRKLEEYNAKMEQQVQRPLGRMSPELMREMGTYDIKQYLTEFAKEGLIQGGKELVRYGAAAISTRSPLLSMHQPLGIAFGVVIDMIVNDLAGRVRERTAGPNEYAQEDAQAHVEGISKLRQGPREFAQGLAEDWIMSYFPDK
ncbi:rhs repeat-associated core domain [Fusarium acutatum]|uniref:Rhs repeat-associated core domain n=1 Tax=Fusarium acutatum TaxID=78861 RepID=A0A8H4P023_9HYPO|nr:rhs repeat-associated core domain [Fusarium acutatum]